MNHRTRISARHIVRGLALAAVALTVCAGAQEVPQAEREALVQIYEATGGPEWHSNDGWLGEPGSECGWYGVTCDIIGDEWRTRELDLAYNGLQGELPQTLAALAHLNHLQLTGNRLGGQIPTELWELESLEFLDLASNEFSGTIPDTLLELNGSVLDVSGNRFTGYRISDGALQVDGTFKRVRLGGNLLEALPPEEWTRDVIVVELNLSDNRLAGSLDASDLPPDLDRLDLSDNDLVEVSGLKTASTPELRVLDLSRNRLATWPDQLDQLHVTQLYLGGNELSGPLPDWLPGLPLFDLDLSDNQLSGDLPEQLADLELGVLDLTDNAFTGPIDPAVNALTGESYGGVWLLVGNNQFSGPLPEDFNPARFNSEFAPNTSHRPRRFGIRGLDLCWNALEIEPEAVEAINDVHRGGAVEDCIGRSRIAVDPSLSGSWYLPERSGEGITQMVLDNGRILTYWFTFRDRFSPSTQMWSVSVGEPGERSTKRERMDIPVGGRFSAGLSDGTLRMLNTPLWYRQSPLHADSAHFSYDFVGGAICLTGFCSWEFHTGRYDQQRLSELAGTRCDNQSPFQQFSGAWYDPERNGEGLIVEALPDDRVVVYWFTYTPDGSGDQAWMIGQGVFENLGLTSDPQPEFPYRAEVDMYQPQGTGFGQDFDTDEIEVLDWGSLELQFREAGDGRIVWDSDLEDYGSGEYPVERLARPMLAECGGDADQS